MTLKEGAIREKIYSAASAFDLWGYGGFGMPRIEMEGDRYIVIEDHGGILEYGPEKITVAADGMKISVIGLGLEIASMDRSSLSLKGRIASVEMRR
ncbi:MAG: YabP/YqfC family sporulation protein [Clostridia bacterium]|nr:YabP/YqfC family sporulation protein [Clostridia bacterium]